MRKIALVSVISFFIIGLFAALAGAADLAKDQSLSIAFDAGDLRSLDPHRATTTSDRATVDMMFNGLVRYPPGNQVKVEPDIAESWTVSADKKVWTFKLRKGVVRPYAAHRVHALVRPYAAHRFHALAPDAPSHAPTPLRSRLAWAGSSPDLEQRPVDLFLTCTTWDLPASQRSQIVTSLELQAGTAGSAPLIFAITVE